MSEDIKQWQTQGQIHQLAGQQIFVRDSAETEKPVILLIHGFPTASWDWCDLWPGLNQHYRLVALDLLGFGYSDKPNPHQYSIMQQADIVDALCTRLELDAYHVLAHDYGDTVAQECLARQNQQQKPQWLSVCFLNGGLFPETHRARTIQKLLASPFGPLFSRMLGLSSFNRSFSAVFGPDTKPSESQLRQFWALINYNQGKHVFHNLISYMADRRQYRQRWLDALKQSKVPVGLINGSADPVSGAHMVQRFRQLVGEDHFIHELPEIGHYPQVEAPDAVLNSYQQFLNQFC